MKLALTEAKAAMLKREVPVGAIIVKGNTVVARSSNFSVAGNAAVAHAELIAIQTAHEQLTSQFLTDCDIYTTLEPCTMCAGAISLARIKRLYFGAYDTKTGAVYNGPQVFNSPSCHHVPEIYGGIMEQECSDLLTEFFQNLRSIKKYKIKHNKKSV